MLCVHASDSRISKKIPDMTKNTGLPHAQQPGILL